MITLAEAMNVSTKPVMLSNRLTNIPNAAQPGRENNSISSAEPNRLTRFRRDNHITLQQEANFLFVVSPGERTDITTPDRPIANAFCSNALFRTGRGDFDAHKTNQATTTGKRKSSP